MTWVGAVIDTLSEILAPHATAVAAAIIAVNGIQNVIYTVQLFLAGVALLRRPIVKSGETLDWLYGDAILPISLIVPAHNEENTMIDSLESLLLLQYPIYEIVFVNDGSSDNTLSHLISYFDMEESERVQDNAIPHQPIRGIYQSRQNRNLFLVDKLNGGKADALNAGINVARMPLFASLDADSLLETESLMRVVEPFVRDPDRVIAVGGTVRVLNDCTVGAGRIDAIRVPRRWLARFQVMEYLRAFLIGRLGWSQVGVLTLIAGAFSVFRRNPVINVGGFYTDTVGEDYELVVRLHRFYREARQPHEITFVPEPVCWTQVPENLRVLLRQRTRWQRGALETLFRHIRIFGNPRYGRVGTIGMPISFVIDFLGPVAETLGYFLIVFFWATGVVDIAFLITFLILIFVYGVFLSTGALLLEELELERYPNMKDLLALEIAAVFENFGYRQINNIFRIIGTFQYFRGRKGNWGNMERRRVGRI